jgi:hypothetical protein
VAEDRLTEKEISERDRDLFDPGILHYHLDYGATHKPF